MAQDYDENWLHMLVVYDHPADAPDHYVLRWWRVRGPLIEHSPVVEKLESLERVHRYIGLRWPQLARIQAMPGDEPQVLEVWM